MEFLNIGGGELLVIVLLALILFGPEDIMKMMRTLGKYARSAREMWNQFTGTMQQEYLASDELSGVLEDTKSSIAEAQDALKAIKSSVSEVTAAAGNDVAAAQRSVKKQASDTAAALQERLKPAPLASVPVKPDLDPAAHNGHQPDGAVIEDTTGTQDAAPPAPTAVSVSETSVPAQDVDAAHGAPVPEDGGEAAASSPDPESVQLTEPATSDVQDDPVREEA